MKRWFALVMNGVMRFAFSRRIALLVLCAAGLALVVGCSKRRMYLCDPAEDCEAPVEEPPFGTQKTCDLHSFEGSPNGICTPYYDAGWDLALVKIDYLEKGQLTFECPESAEWAGLWGEEVVFWNIAPRSVLACSVHPLATCGDLGSACVPKEEEFPACAIQTGQHDCPGLGLIPTEVKPYGGGDLSTVCCSNLDLPQ
jgi:hypothetical protein